jgi:hypothetical protein
MKTPHIAALTLLAAATVAASAPTELCFDEMEQRFEWDDGGLQWRLHPLLGCPNASASDDHRWGGSLEIRASGTDASVVEEDYAWVLEGDPATGRCLRVYKSVTRTTTVLKNGVRYEVRQTDQEAPHRSERPMPPPGRIPVGHMVVPSPTDPNFNLLGTETIAGHTCQRLTMTHIPPGGASTTACVVNTPITCWVGRYMQPLEYTITLPDGQVLTRARTTVLQYGARGSVFPSGAISPP